MNIQELKHRFQDRLKALYSTSESLELFYILAQSRLKLTKIQLKSQEETPLLFMLETTLLHELSLLEQGVPYQHILGEVNFFGLDFLVTKGTLIPRPETEELVEWILKDNSLSTKKSLNVVDIGTGSGCIAICIAKHWSSAQVSAIDISSEALEVAKQNAKRHRVELRFLKQDVLKQDLEGVYDLIVSNPPYIDTTEAEEISHSVKNFEPNIALFAPENRPLAFYQKIAESCENHLSMEGSVFLEINQKLGIETLNLFKEVLSEVRLVKDLSGNDRFLIGRK